MRVATLLLVVLALAGCGGDSGVSSPDKTDETIGDVNEAPQPAVHGSAERGQKVFADAGCGGCHTFAAAASKGTQGPRLDESDVTVAEAIEQIRTGGGGMPAFNGRLSEQSIQDVAAFVVEKRAS